MAAFSPAILSGAPVFDDAAALRTVPLGIWCGTSDPFYAQVRAFTNVLPVPPKVETYADGGHTRFFWNDHTLAAFRFLSGYLSR